MKMSKNITTWEKCLMTAVEIRVILRPSQEGAVSRVQEKAGSIAGAGMRKRSEVKMKKVIAGILAAGAIAAGTAMILKIIGKKSSGASCSPLGKRFRKHGSIAIIGGADGPAAIYCTDGKKKVRCKPVKNVHK